MLFIYGTFEDSLRWCRGMTPPPKKKDSKFKLQRSHHFFSNPTVLGGIFFEDGLIFLHFGLIRKDITLSFILLWVFVVVCTHPFFC